MMEGKERQGGQKADHTGRQRPQCPDCSSNPFWVTWVVFSQGLKILAVYLQYYSRQSSKHKGRSKEKGVVINGRGYETGKVRRGRERGQGIEDGREVEEREEASGGWWEGDGWRKGRGRKRKGGRGAGGGEEGEGRGRGGRD